jgi:hypothetical protein
MKAAIATVNCATRVECVDRKPSVDQRIEDKSNAVADVPDISSTILLNSAKI